MGRERLLFGKYDYPTRSYLWLASGDSLPRTKLSDLIDIWPIRFGYHQVCHLETLKDTDNLYEQPPNHIRLLTAPLVSFEGNC